jgi:hypothetical protein
MVGIPIHRSEASKEYSSQTLRLPEGTQSTPYSDMAYTAVGFTVVTYDELRQARPKIHIQADWCS